MSLAKVTAVKHDIKANFGDSITTYLSFAFIGGPTALTMLFDLWPHDLIECNMCLYNIKIITDATQTSGFANLIR